MKGYIIDTNVVVRFLMQDEAAMSAGAAKLFQRASKGEIELYFNATIVAEVTFVLTSFYKKKREEVADALLDLIDGCRLKTAEIHIVRDALQRFKSFPVAFPDALVAAIAANVKLPVASFDRDFDRFTDISRFEPRE
jgi:predicted nucleic acid-binding protein